MPGGGKRVYWDANCFLFYINGDAERLPVLEALLAQSARDEIRIVTSTVSIVEVAFGLKEQDRRAASPHVEEQINALWRDNKTIELVEFFERIAYEARELIRNGLARGWRLHAGDAIHLATAQAIGAVEMHTYDDRLYRYGELLGIPVREPSVAQGRLF